MRVFLKRRALSTVVTSAILLTAVAVIGTGVVLWSNSNLKSFENTLVTSASDKTNKINEIPIIENVILDPNNGGSKLVNVTITNSGTIGFNVTQITLNSSATTVINKVTNGGIIAHSSKLFSYTFNWVNSRITTVQVTTARGTVISTQAVHP
jgi:hypothetical protein